MKINNIAALDNALAHIDANPDEWNQVLWICGSMACVAGRIALQAGKAEDLGYFDDVASVALKILGLEDVYEGNHPLFSGVNTREALTLWRMVLAGERVIMPGADLSGSNLMGADLREADLKDSDLSSANLENAILTNADLSGANLEGANLEGANLSGANLEGANLEGANLEGAYLEGAYLEGANLLHTDLG